jgi:hypothetical protein
MDTNTNHNNYNVHILAKKSLDLTAQVINDNEANTILPSESTTATSTENKNLAMEVT